MNDKKLITAIKSKNETAINDVIEKYAKLLWSVAGTSLSGIGSTQDIEECVADTFIYLWENVHKFDPQRGSLKSWLSVIARSKAADRCRELTKRSTLPLEDHLLINRFGITDLIIQEEKRQQLITAVNALEEPDREILVRRYFFEQKPKQIAFALNMSVKQVDNRLYHTKRKLRKAISE